VLDEEVLSTKDVPAPWRRAAIAQPLIPIGVVLVLALVVGVAGLPTSDTASGVYTLLAGLAAGACTVLVGRPVARAYGGWRAAFGFDLPRRGDLRTVLRWLGVQVASRLGLLVVLTAVSPSLSESHGGNTEDLPNLPPVALVLAGVAAVLLAPVAEELAFRGVLLRALMRRLPFWPAALISSALFAVLHAGGVSHVAAIPLLVVVILLFGVLQCVLVRRTGRLGPAIGVHGLMNLLVLWLGVAAG
jgi:membrane protease YdiL (CAAX protease family)